MKFETLFFEKSDFLARNGKAVYISKEHHERLLRITRVLAENKISITNYLDNILKHHFTEFETEIKKEFKAKYKPLF